MSKSDKIISGPLLAAVVFGGGYLARKGIGKAWSGVTKEPIPPKKNNAEAELGEAVTWAVATGVAVGLFRFALRRANYKGSPLE
ncbi:DUF4235 domain-containing protein [Aliiglaciecola litoralis]|uniref:DUF4235 domain-containing protein n=1 Tax=Aliiglaciecola litoralis TaxID=582857 RepID=A0ABP3WUI1_9ALTE